ncbi:MAG: YegS/Rv2252/BmrU family lipid kinase [Planctomycetota bacterium]
MMENTLFVVNPVSAKGLTGRQWPDIKLALEKALNEPIKEILTETESLVSKIVRSALKESVRTIVSVGGDGTHSQVIKGFFEEAPSFRPVCPEASLVFMSRGTGGDLCRHFHLGKDLKFVVDSLQGQEFPFDVGLLTYHDHQGVSQTRTFVNITSLGLGGETALKMKQLKKGTALSYLFTTLSSAMRYKSKFVQVFVDEQLFYEGKIHLVALANGSQFGGGMHIAPNASTSDGLLDVIILKHLTKFQVFTKISKVYSGKHLALKEVLSTSGRQIRITSPETVLLEIDGDPLGQGPIEAKILPSALKVRLPKTPNP